MTTRPGFAYLHARLQARHGSRPDDAQWRALDATRGLPAYLAEARRGGLAPWIASLPEGRDPHALEQALRRRLHEALDEIVTWTPKSWRPAVAWCHWLPELSLLDRLLAEEPLPSWLAADRRLAPYLAETAEARRAALVRAGAAALIEGWEGGEPVAAWRAEWRRRWPRGVQAMGRSPDQVAAAVATHLHDFATYPMSDAWLARSRFQERMVRLFRRHPVGPVALFAYLALIALDVERLRAGLVERAVFAPVEVAS